MIAWVESKKWDKIKGADQELLVDRVRIQIENVEISRKIKIKQTFVFQALFIGALVDDRENNAGKPKTARVSLKLLVDRGRIQIENVEISRKIKIKQTFVIQTLFIGALVDDRENNAGKPKTARVSLKLLVDRGRIQIENVEISRKIKIKQTFVIQTLFIGALVDDRENNAGKPKTARVSLKLLVDRGRDAGKNVGI